MSSAWSWAASLFSNSTGGRPWSAQSSFISSRASRRSSSSCSPLSGVAVGVGLGVALRVAAVGSAILRSSCVEAGEICGSRVAGASIAGRCESIQPRMSALFEIQNAAPAMRSTKPIRRELAHNRDPPLRGASFPSSGAQSGQRRPTTVCTTHAEQMESPHRPQRSEVSRVRCLRQYDRPRH